MTSTPSLPPRSKPLIPSIPTTPTSINTTTTTITNKPSLSPSTYSRSTSPKFTPSVLSDWAFSHLPSRFHPSPRLKAPSWPPEEWFSPPHQRTSSASSSSSSYVFDRNDHGCHEIQSSTSPRRVPPKIAQHTDGPILSEPPSATHKTFSSVLSQASTLCTSPMSTNLIKPSDPINHSYLPSAVPDPLTGHTLSRTETVNSLLTQSVVIVDSPSNTISLAPPLPAINMEDEDASPDTPTVAVINSPVTTQSLAPANSVGCLEASPALEPVFESPSNTISLAPSPELIQLSQSPLSTQSIPSHGTQMARSNNSSSQSSTNTPISTTSSPKPALPPRRPLAFHPPPSHPDTRVETGVKETLDAHLGRSEDGYRQVNQYILKQGQFPYLLSHHRTLINELIKMSIHHIQILVEVHLGRSDWLSTRRRVSSTR